MPGAGASTPLTSPAFCVSAMSGAAVGGFQITASNGAVTDLPVPDALPSMLSTQ